MRQTHRKAPARRRAIAGAAGALAGAVVTGTPAAVSAAPGDLDLGFGGASHGRVLSDFGKSSALAVQSDGRIVTVGSAVNGSGVDAVASRFKADGTVDDRFGVVTLPPAPSGTSTTAVANAVAVQPDGKLVVAGFVTDGGNNHDFAVWRLKSSGTLDTSFDGDGLVQFGGDTTDDTAWAVAVDPQGRIVVAGTNASVGGADLGVLRLTPPASWTPLSTEACRSSSRSMRALTSPALWRCSPTGRSSWGGSMTVAAAMSWC